MKPFKFGIKISAGAQSKLAEEKKAQDVKILAQKRAEAIEEAQREQLESQQQQQESILDSNNDNNNTQFKRPKMNNNDDEELSQAASTEINKNNDSESDDDWGPRPLLSIPTINPKSALIVSSITAAATTTPTVDTFTTATVTNKRQFTDWDNDSDYDDDNDDNNNNNNNNIETKQQNNNELIANPNEIINQYSLPNMFEFDSAIHFPLSHITPITALTTHIIDHTPTSSFRNINHINYNTYENNHKISTIMSSTNLFDGLLLHCGHFDGSLTAIDFSLYLFKSPHRTTLPKAQTITKLLPIQYYNPNPHLYKYDPKANITQNKYPIHLIALTDTNQFYALSQSHKVIATSKAGYPLRFSEKEPGHIAPIRDIIFSPPPLFKPLLPLQPLQQPNIQPIIMTLLQQFGLQKLPNEVINGVNSTPQNQMFLQEFMKWQQSYSNLHLHRTTLLTGGDDANVRVWDLKLPDGQTIEGNLQYYFEKSSVQVFKLNTHSLTSSSSLSYQHDKISCQFPQFNLELNYKFIPNTKPKITTLCQIDDKYLLIGTRGGLIFGIDLSKNVKESIWVINPTQYLPVSAQIDNNTKTSIDIHYDDSFEVKQFYIISPKQAMVIVSGPEQCCCFIFDLTNFGQIKHHSTYLNQMVIFYHTELEITSFLPAYSDNLPQLYHQHKFDSEQLQQRQKLNPNHNDEDNVIVPNLDGLLTGVILGVRINKSTKTKYKKLSDQIKSSWEILQAQLQNNIDLLKMNKDKFVKDAKSEIKSILDTFNPLDYTISRSDDHDDDCVKQEQYNSSINVKVELGDNDNDDHNDHQIHHQDIKNEKDIEEAGKKHNNNSTHNIIIPSGWEHPTAIESDDSVSHKVYTMAQLDELEQIDTEQQNQTFSQNYRFPTLSQLDTIRINSDERYHLKLLSESRPGVDYQIDIPGVDKGQSVLSRLLYNFQSPLQQIQLELEQTIALLSKNNNNNNNDDVENNNTSNTHGNINNDHSNKHNFELIEKSNFIISIRLNLPSQWYHTDPTTSSLLSSQSSPSPSLLLTPTIDSISHLHSHIYSLGWYKSMIIAGSDNEVIFLPNTAHMITNQYQHADPLFLQSNQREKIRIDKILNQQQGQKSKFLNQILTQLTSAQTSMFKNELNTTIVEKGSNNKGTNKTQPKTQSNDDDHDDDGPKTRFNPHTQHKMLVQSLTAKKPIIGSKSTFGDDGNK
jgi:hypothetical protein